MVKSIDRGKDSAVFVYAEEKSNDRHNEETGIVNPEQSFLRQKDFKQSQSVIVKENSRDAEDCSLKGSVIGSKSGESVTIAFEKYDLLRSEDSKKNTLRLKKDKEYQIGASFSW